MAENFSKLLLDTTSAITEKMQGIHVENKMAPICMNETAAEKPVPLPAINSRWVKYKIVNYPMVTEGADGNDRGDDNNYQRK